MWGRDLVVVSTAAVMFAGACSRQPLKSTDAGIDGRGGGTGGVAGTGSGGGGGVAGTGMGGTGATGVGGSTGGAGGEAGRGGGAGGATAGAGGATAGAGGATAGAGGATAGAGGQAGSSSAGTGGATGGAGGGAGSGGMPDGGLVGITCPTMIDGALRDNRSDADGTGKPRHTSGLLRGTQGLSRQRSGPGRTRTSSMSTASSTRRAFPTCFSFTLTYDATTGLQRYVAAYSSYDPTNIGGGYLGDVGAVLTSPQTMGITVPAGGTIDVVVFAIESRPAGWGRTVEVRDERKRWPWWHGRRRNERQCRQERQRRNGRERWNERQRWNGAAAAGTGGSAGVGGTAGSGSYGVCPATPPLISACGPEESNLICSYPTVACGCANGTTWSCAACPAALLGPGSLCVSGGLPGQLRCQYGNVTCSCANSSWGCGVCPAAHPQTGAVCGNTSFDCRYGADACRCSGGVWTCATVTCPADPGAFFGSCSTLTSYVCTYAESKQTCTCDGNNPIGRCSCPAGAEPLASGTRCAATASPCRYADVECSVRPGAMGLRAEALPGVAADRRRGMLVDRQLRIREHLLFVRRHDVVMLVADRRAAPPWCHVHQTAPRF